MAAGEILIKWVSESAGAVRDMNRMNRAFGQTESKWQKASRGIDRAGTIAAGALAAMVPIGVELIKSASDQEQAFGALDAVFKDYSDAVKDAAKSAADFGLSATEYGEFATVIGAQLQNLGLELGDAATQTQDLIGLAGDMAAQFGGSTAEAVQALSSALRGERDPIEKYAVSLNEASIKAKMAEENLSPVEATLALINEQLTKSGTVGAAAREYDTFASSTQRLSAEWDNFKASIFGSDDGQSTGAAAELIDELTKSLRGVSNWINNNPAAFKKIAAGIAGVAAALVTLKASLAVIGTLQTFAGVIKRFPKASGIGILTGMIAALYNALKDVDTNASGALGSLKRFWDLKAPFSGDWWVTRMIQSFNDAVDSANAALESLNARVQNFRAFSWITDTFPGIFGGRSAPMMDASTIGRVAPTAGAGGNVAVYVDGQRRPARVRPEPVWQPHVTLGVI